MNFIQGFSSVETLTFHRFRVYEKALEKAMKFHMPDKHMKKV